MEKAIEAIEIPEDLSPEEFENFDDGVASTEPNLSDEAIIEMALDEQIIELDDEEEEGNDNNSGLVKPTGQQLRTASKHLDFSLFMMLRNAQ